MWIVKLVTLIEYHPLLTLGALLILLGAGWCVRRELKRPSFRQQNDLERLLDGMEHPELFEGGIEEE